MSDDDPVVHNYDGDYPSPDGRFPENFDQRAWEMGVADDVPWYVRIGRARAGAALDLGCGTGRVAIPLVIAGVAVTAVDISPAMLDVLRDKASRLSDEARRSLEIIEADIVSLDLGRRYEVVFLPFSALLCVPDRERQIAALGTAARHLEQDGILALDVHNPLALPARGDPVPRRVLTRRNPITGRRYSRFATLGPIDEDQRQVNEGWYETEGAGRASYKLLWRLIHRHELELMMRIAGLDLLSIHGGSHGEPYTTSSQRMFITACHAGAPRRDPLGFAPAILDGVGRTALLTAAARAAEGQRSNALFCDPLALRFAGDRGRALLAELDGELAAFPIVVRTCWFDDAIRRALDGGARVVLSLGAGLDARWHRIEVPSDVYWVEVDAADVLAYKAARLADVKPRPHLISLAASLEDASLAEKIDAALAGAGGDVAAPRLVLIEGVISYLDKGAVEALFQAIASMPEGTVTLYDVASSSALDTSGPAARFSKTLQRSGAAFRFGTDAPGELAERHGLSAEVTFVGARDAHYGRAPGAAASSAEDLNIVTWLVKAR